MCRLVFRATRWYKAVIVLPPTLCKEPVGSPRVFILLGFSFLRALFAGAALVHRRRFVFFVEGALMC